MIWFWFYDLPAKVKHPFKQFIYLNTSVKFISIISGQLVQWQHSLDPVAWVRFQVPTWNRTRCAGSKSKNATTRPTNCPDTFSVGFYTFSVGFYTFSVGFYTFSVGFYKMFKLFQSMCALTGKWEPKNEMVKSFRFQKILIHFQRIFVVVIILGFETIYF